MGKQKIIVYSNDMLGRIGERRVANYLTMAGFSVKRMPHFRSSHDLLINDKFRVEVKTSNRNRRGGWMVNFHRHGKTDEKGIDLYIVSLWGVFGKNASIYLMFRAPVESPTIFFTPRSILMRYAFNAQAFQIFMKTQGKKLPGKTPEIPWDK